MAKPPAEAFDVIVVGAGAAGLAAADVLVRAGCRALILEARDRIGGRAWTRRMPGLDVPVELGAEFVHGRAAATLALLKRAGGAMVASGRAQRYVERGKLKPVDAFAEAKKAMHNRACLGERDVPFSAFLERQAKLKPLTRTFARLMVQGFDAADPDRASARAIAQEWAGGDALLGAQPRLRAGYGPALEWLARGIVRRAGRLRLESEVTDVRWCPGVVRISTAAAHFEASRAIITVPLGVLQHGAIRFMPALDKTQALRALASGPVIKAALRFPKAFWEARSRGVSFFHSPRAVFPTFWTPRPWRVPLLIAWSGGSNAQKLAGLSKPELLTIALRSLRTIFRHISDPDHVYLHDWHADRFAQGAYSYELVNSEGARQALQAPVAKTLYFAGEATNLQGESGTVSGALQSGIRAAREVLASFAAPEALGSIQLRRRR